jgi:hypothetical protein
VEGNDNNIISLSEWRRVQRRLERMDLRELAITTHRLIDLMIDLTSHLQDLQDRVDRVSSQPPENT